MLTSISATGFKGGLLSSSFHGNWGKSVAGENYYYTQLPKSAPTRVRVRKPVRFQPVMKNVNEGKGIFAPIVVFTRNIVGRKRFNQLRGKAIALHSQVPLFSCSKTSLSRTTYLCVRVFVRIAYICIHISLYSQVITEFCKSIGADAKQRQGLIRLAKKNGERLGFLA